MATRFSLRARWLMVVTVVVVGSAAANAQVVRQPPRQLTISEDILTSFVDQPCYHFEQAHDKYLSGDRRAAANHLRIGAAFLKLEAARATEEGRKGLTASIRELEQLAFAIEYLQVRTVDTLDKAFANAHFAMAGHHCISSAHRCCQQCSFSDKQEMTNVGQDLKSAAVHLQNGSRWSGNAISQETKKVLSSTFATADGLIAGKTVTQPRALGVIGAFRQRFEDLTGRRLLIAPAPTGLGISPPNLSGFDNR